MQEIEQLEKSGFVRFKIPACITGKSAFDKKVDAIKNHFKDRLTTEFETGGDGRAWVRFELREI